MPRSGSLKKLEQKVGLGGRTASDGDLGEGVLYFEEGKNGFGSSGERLRCYRAGVAVLAIDFGEFMFRSSRKLPDSAPQQGSTDLQSGFVIGREWAPREEDCCNGGFIHRQRAQVVGDQSRLLQFLAGRGDRVAGSGEVQHDHLDSMADRRDERG